MNIYLSTAHFFNLDLQILKINQTNIKLNVLYTVKCAQYTMYHIENSSVHQKQAKRDDLCEEKKL